MQAEHPDRFEVEWLPAYAPELKPVEMVWNHTKYTDLANFIPDNVDDLRQAVATSIILASFFRALIAQELRLGHRL